MQTPGAIVSALSTLVLHGLPDDYYPTLRRQYLAATVADVSAAAADHLHEQSLTLVVEGDAAQFRDDMNAAALGEVVDAEL